MRIPISRAKILLPVLVLAVAFSACGGPSTGASATVTVSNPPSPPGPPPPPPPGSQDFATRCAQPGVLKCVGFDAPSDIAGGVGDNSGITSGATTPSIDTAVKASGAGSVKFTLPPNAAADTSGTYFTNFSANLLVQFGENQEFYVQWRQRFTPEMITTIYQSGGGYKQIIIGTGDKPGCTSSSSASGLCYASCTALETVVGNLFNRGLPQMYNSCAGSTSHGPFATFDEPFSTPWNAGNFKLQNARPSPYCLYDNQGQSRFPPTGNCFGYFPDEWMTFQIKIKTGPRLTTGAQDEWINSKVTLWIARESQASQLVIDFPWNLTAGSPAENQKYGKVWLLPYNTGRDSIPTYTQTYTWYDELIISQNPIADPQ